MNAAVVALFVAGLFGAYAIAQIFANQQSNATGTNVSIADLIEASVTGNLTAAQLAVLAQNAGFQGPNVVIAVAIALAESGGNAKAYNPETAAGAAANMGSYGLWQIYLTAHPEYQNSNLYDPQTNANAAFAVYSASGFSAWSTFNSGAYEAHLSSAQNAVNA